GKATKDLAVTRIRKPHFVGAIHHVSVLPVAVKLALPRDGIPEKGHQGFPPLFGSGFPETRLQLLGIANILLVAYQCRISAGVQFLPAKTVERDDEYIVCLLLAANDN